MHCLRLAPADGFASDVWPVLLEILMRFEKLL
jgi:hypothetical protein